MTDHLTALFSALIPLWEMSLTAAFAAAVVLVLRLALKRRAPRQVICLLWLIVFVRMLIPVHMESRVSVVPAVLTAPPAATASPGDPIETAPIQAQSPNYTAQTPAAAVSPVPVTSAVPHETAHQVQPAVPDTPAAETAVSGREAPFPWRALLAGAWLAGAAAMLGHALISYLSLRRKVFAAVLSPDGAWEHPHVHSPFILGILRPRIYLPAGYSGAPRQFILCHERAHLRRRDHIVKPICWLALALHWFNPMAWIAFLLMSRDIEVACDQAVLRQLGPDVKADYSTTLLALATNGRFPTPCPLAFGEGDVKARIKNILDYKKPALWIAAAAAAAAVIAAVCLLTDPVASSGPGAGASAPPEIDDCDTYPWYPGLYFQTEQDDESGRTEYRAYQLTDGELVLIGGWVNYPGNNFSGVIGPDGTEEQLFGDPLQAAADYEQLLVDACVERNPNWADALHTTWDGDSDEGGFTYLNSTRSGISLYACPTSYDGYVCTLIRCGDALQVIPYRTYGDRRDLHILSFTDLDGDGQDELVISFPGTSSGTHCDEDLLVVCEWDGARWTCFQHDLNAAITSLRDSLTFEETGGSLAVRALGLSAQLPASLYASFSDQWDELTGGLDIGLVDYSYIAQYSYTSSGGLQLRLTLSASPDQAEALSACADLFDFCYDLQYTGDGQFDDTPYEFEPILADAALVAIVPSAQAYLYELDAYGETFGEYAVLYWGDAVYQISYPLYSYYESPSLSCQDFDGDGTDELAMIYTIGHGTECYVSQLTVFEREGSQITEIPFDGWKELAADFNRGNSALADHEANTVDVTYQSMTWHAQINAPENFPIELSGPVASAYIPGEQVYHYFSGGDFMLRLMACLADTEAGVLDILSPQDGDTAHYTIGYFPITLYYTVRYTGGGFTAEIIPQAGLPDGLVLMASLEPDTNLYMDSSGSLYIQSLTAAGPVSAEAQAVIRGSGTILLRNAADIDGDGYNEVTLLRSYRGTEYTTLRWSEEEQQWVE